VAVSQFPAGSGPVILIVDDDHFSREFLKGCLADSPSSYRVMEASDGDEALKAIDDQIPGLVFLDLVMPRKSGLEVLIELRSRNRDLRIVIISSLDTPQLVEQALAKGADAFVTKPFDAAEIEKVIRKFLPS
jgi:CheY-like chemotaxis protein